MTHPSTHIRVIDLFSGAGGFTLGFVKSGFEPIFANDIDPDSAATYAANFGAHCVTADINQIATFPTAEVIIGGPPCQGFSNLGTRLADDPRNQLWRHFIRAVEQIRPLAFVVENVPPLLKSAEGQAIMQAARAMGYAVEGRILNAADYGAFQVRKRTIMIGSRIGEVHFPERTHVDPTKSNGKQFLPLLDGQPLHALVPWRSVREAIGDLPLEPTGESLHFGRNPTPKSLERYRHVPPGGNRWDLPLELTPDCWIRKTKGGTDLFGRLWWDRPSVTIRTEFFKPEKGRYLHPVADRPITHREAARIQGFPDDFQFTGSKISVARQIGNAVPIQLAEAIAKAVWGMIRDAQTF